MLLSRDRQGRKDGLPADALMFYSYGDVAMLTHFVEDSGQVGINKEKLQRMQSLQKRKCAEGESC